MPGLLLTRTWYSVLADLGSSGGQDQVLQVDGVRDVDGRELLGVEFIEVKIDHHGSCLAAERVRDGGALNGSEGRSDKVVAEIEDFLFAESLAGEAELEDRHAGRVVLQNVGGNMPGGIWRRAVFMVAVVCAMAMSTFTLGWK